MTARKADLADLPDWPRRLSREQAAAYVGISPSGFDERVARHLLPSPVPGWGKRVLWDRRQLDAALDAEIGLNPGSPPSDSFDPIAEDLHAYRAGRRQQNH